MWLSAVPSPSLSSSPKSSVRTHKEELKERIAKLRREIPDIALRTTLISGFPGETEEDHEELMEFVDEMEFERLGVFAYSAEEDTPAYSYPDQVPQEVKEERRDAIIELQQEIAFEHCEKLKCGCQPFLPRPSHLLQKAPSEPVRSLRRRWFLKLRLPPGSPL